MLQYDRFNFTQQVIQRNSLSLPGLGQRPQLRGGWWAQLATQRPGLLLSLGPLRTDSPTNTAGALACVLHVPAALAQVSSGSAWPLSHLKSCLAAFCKRQVVFPAFGEDCWLNEEILGNRVPQRCS